MISTERSDKLAHPVLGATAELGVVVVLLAVILGVNFAGVFRGWYQTIWWYDIPMHLAGGAWVALLFFYLIGDRGDIISVDRGVIGNLLIIVLVLSFVSFIGILWELFEYLFDVFIASRHPLFFAQQGLADTMGDFVNNLLGGSAMAGVHLFLKRGSGITRGFYRSIH